MNFIYQEYIEDLSLCDKLIEYHKRSSEKTDGKIGFKVQPEKKKSTDVYLIPNQVEKSSIAHQYFLQLLKVLEKYVAEYKFSGEYGQFGLIEPVCIQHYKPDEGFFIWHTERMGPKPPLSLRHLVFMTYLNDVEQGGETEFYYQKLKIKPKKGLTVIWPSDWTHTHRGITSTEFDKYIITGWFDFY